MKRTVILCSLILAVAVSSCWTKGESTLKLDGSESLPEEIRGMKVYKVNIDKLNFIYVGYIKGLSTTSLSYPVGKTQQTMILINGKDQQKPPYKIFAYKEIIMENDSLVIIRK